MFLVKSHSSEGRRLHKQMEEMERIASVLNFKSFKDFKYTLASI